MKVAQILLSLISVLDPRGSHRSEDIKMDEYDASATMPSWEEHPKVREFRKPASQDFYRSYHNFH